LWIGEKQNVFLFSWPRLFQMARKMETAARTRPFAFRAEGLDYDLKMPGMTSHLLLEKKVRSTVTSTTASTVINIAGNN
jgi:hypothetical protein